MIGGGKYGEHAERILAETNAEGVLVIVLEGRTKGHGFSVAATKPIIHMIPDILRHVAGQIDDDLKRGGN